MAADRRRGAHPASRPAPQRVGRVLLVEDEQDVAELIRYNLAKEGYDVVMTANGADALRLARERQPDVVLLDIMVPQLNGWEVCRRLRLRRAPDRRRPRRPAAGQVHRRQGRGARHRDGARGRISFPGRQAVTDL